MKKLLGVFLIVCFVQFLNTAWAADGDPVLEGKTATGNITTGATLQGEHVVSTDDADIADNLTAGDVVIDEAAGVLNFTGATSATISAPTAALLTLLESVTIGDNSDNDFSITFDGDTSDGILNYDEDNADFEFNQDVASTGNIEGATLTYNGAEVYRVGGTDVAATDGGTGKSSWTQYAIPYAPTTTTIGEITPAASSVMVTDGSNIPSLATDIPTAVTIGAKYIYRADGTDVPVVDGGTGAGTFTDGGLLVGAGTSPFEALAAGLTTEVLVGGGAGTNPAWGTDLPTAVTIGTKYIYRADGTDVAIADGGTGAGTATAAFDALSPMTTVGDLIYGGASGTGTRLAAGATTEILVGGGAAAPVWTTATGTGAPARAGSPTFTTKITTPTIDLTGGQIAFPATAVPSANVNTLDDYEEGTWTPVYTPETGSFTSLTMNCSSPKYTRIGNLVTLTAFISTSVVDPTGASGYVSITGLPFSVSGYASGAVTLTSNWSGDVPISCAANGSTIYLYYRTSANGVDTTLKVSDMAGTGANYNALVISITYMAS